MPRDVSQQVCVTSSQSMACYERARDAVCRDACHRRPWFGHKATPAAWLPVSPCSPSPLLLCASLLQDCNERAAVEHLDSKRPACVLLHQVSPGSERAGWLEAGTACCCCLASKPAALQSECSCGRCHSLADACHCAPLIPLLQDERRGSLEEAKGASAHACIASGNAVKVRCKAL